MANENEIPLNITADTDVAQKQLEQFTAAVTKLMGNLNQSIEGGIAKPLENVAKASKSNGDKIAAAFTGIKIAAAAAFAVFAGREVFSFLSESVNQAAEYEAAINKLNYTLASTGEFSKEASEGIVAYAESIQQSTTYTDDAVIGAITLAKTFGLTNNAAIKLVDAATNLAAVQGTDLNTATDKLLLSLNGQGKALKDLGPDFVNLTEQQLKASGAVNLVAERFKGAASALTNTFSGAVKQATNQFEDLQKTIGKFVLDSESVTGGIKLFSLAINNLSNTIEDNPELFASALKSITGFAAFIGGTAVQLIGRFIIGLENIKVLTKDFIDIIVGGFTFVIGKITEFIGSSLKLVSAFDGIGSAAKELGQLIGIDGAKQFQRGTNSTSDYAQEHIKAAAGVRLLTDGASKAIDALSSGEKITKSQSAALAKLNDSAKNSTKGYGKLREEATKFIDDLQGQSGDAFSKAEIQRAQDLKKIKEFLDNGDIYWGEAFRARTKIQQNFLKTTDGIREKDRKDAQAALDKVNEDYAKSLEERKKLIEGAFKDPIQAAINFDTSSGSAKQVGAAIGLGIVSEMLNGAKGAQKILSAGIGAAAEAFLPGFGGAIGQLADQLLTLGPDGAKAMVREFVDALPDLIIKLADAIPAVVEALVDSLINKGGIGRIAVALLRAMSGESAWRAIGKQIGTEATYAMVNGLKGFFATLGAQISSAFQAAIQAFRAAVVDMFKVAGAGIGLSISNPLSATLDRIKGLAPELGKYLSGALDRINDLAPKLGNYLSGALDRIEGLANYLADKVKVAVNTATGGGSGVVGGVVSTVKRAAGLATGGLVPPGFNNDTFPARLTSGELVIPKDLVGSLSDFLDVGLSPKKDNGDINTAILGKIAALLGQPMNVESSINISGQAFADIILKLSRNNARLSA